MWQEQQCKCGIQGDPHWDAPFFWNLPALGASNVGYPGSLLEMDHLSLVPYSTDTEAAFKKKNPQVIHMCFNVWEPWTRIRKQPRSTHWEGGVVVRENNHDENVSPKPKLTKGAFNSRWRFTITFPGRVWSFPGAEEAGIHLASGDYKFPWDIPLRGHLKSGSGSTTALVRVLVMDTERAHSTVGPVLSALHILFNWTLATLKIV